MFYLSKAGSSYLHSIKYPPPPSKSSNMLKSGLLSQQFFAFNTQKEFLYILARPTESMPNLGIVGPKGMLNEPIWAKIS